MNFTGVQQLLTIGVIPAVFIGVGGCIAVVYLILSGALSRTHKATVDYEGTLVGNVIALKDRVALLERWRDEATALEHRVQGLEQQIQELTRSHASELEGRDAEIGSLRDELTQTKSDLSAAHAKIRRLEKALHAPGESETPS